MFAIGLLMPSAVESDGLQIVSFIFGREEISLLTSVVKLPGRDGPNDNIQLSKLYSIRVYS
ncbi:hypothetical protein T440DRAFT_74243 [Plenodomus tracheiphilus IPT5]|uniref:Uncharacterized protein n=1 Tax=Plenodomus tracheiphilus IPT5 TaxID=1408161 RepID=A0A6A7B5V0_9PLEO|nr:hypothetical protein T440DRAFT_74243 [Plenodomus tracheiphilus IPT5]